MPRLADLVEQVRSKNAGPFWLTCDIFCGSRDAFNTVASALSSERVAEVFHRSAGDVERHEMPELNVIKLSLPRPVVQGSRFDRDMHGAQWAVLLAELEIAVPGLPPAG